MLQYGLNVNQKRKRPPPAAFGDADEASQVEGKNAVHTQSYAPLKPSADTAESLEDVYDYDAAWDEMKKADRRRQAESGTEKAERKPKYMQQLLAAAEVRKRGQLRAKERQLQRERDTESEEFADKERFVTGAYKKHQDEMRRLEEEERLKEQNLAQRSQGMTSFYRNMMDEAEKKHQDIAQAPQKALSKGSDTYAAQTSEHVDKSISQATVGKGVGVNEDGEVVNKRELLSAGLNLSKRASAGPLYHRRKGASKEVLEHRNIPSQTEARTRQSEMIEKGITDMDERRATEASKKEADAAHDNKSHKTEGDIQSARERYLARRKVR